MEIFKNRFEKVRPYEFPDRVHTQITFEFDRTLYRIDRDVYSILDWIGDVGGLNEGVKVALGCILMFLQFNNFDHFLIERLFHTEKKEPKKVWWGFSSKPKVVKPEEKIRIPLRNNNTTWWR